MEPKHISDNKKPYWNKYQNRQEQKGKNNPAHERIGCATGDIEGLYAQHKNPIPSPTLPSKSTPLTVCPKIFIFTGIK